MATLSVLKFETPEGAGQMEQTLLALQKQQLIVVQDAAIVTWPQGKKSPKTQQLHSLAGQGAMMGAFWGMLFGLLFFIPFFGLAVGAAMGALRQVRRLRYRRQLHQADPREGHRRHLGAVPADQRRGDGQGRGSGEGPEVRDHLDEPDQRARRSAARGARRRIKR